MTKAASDPQATREHLRVVLKEFDTAMLLSHTDDGYPRARPMAIAEARDDGTLLFATGIDSPKVHEIEANPTVAVTMQAKSRFVSISGRGRMVRDRALIDRLWSEAWRVWFPGGKDDPNLCLLEVDPFEAEYWDNAGARGLKYLFEAARAVVKGQKPLPADGDQNAKVRL
jgi:general stress protein 26